MPKMLTIKLLNLRLLKILKILFNRNKKYFPRDFQKFFEKSRGKVLFFIYFCFFYLFYFATSSQIFANSSAEFGNASKIFLAFADIGYKSLMRFNC